MSLPGGQSPLSSERDGRLRWFDIERGRLSEPGTLEFRPGSGRRAPMARRWINTRRLEVSVLVERLTPRRTRERSEGAPPAWTT